MLNFLLSKNIKSLELNPTTANGFDAFKSVLDEFHINSESILEIGGGSSPTYSPSSNFTVNDISSHELSFIKDKNYNTALFDISGKVSDSFNEKFDFCFSKMVLEHVSNGELYYKNVFKILKKGGTCITFHPTLFSVPFLINYLLPQKSSDWVFNTFLGKKNRILEDNKIKIIKFPAKYSYCFSTKKHKTNLEKIGFSNVKIISLYGHHYYRWFQLLYKFHKKITKLIKKNDIKFLSSYAYTIVQK